MASTELGARLKHFRLAQHLTQTALADKLHVSRQTVSSWETGRNQPDIATITQLADLYATSLDGLLQGTAAETTSKTAPAQPSMGLLGALLGILLVERLTQISTFPGLYWLDFLIVLLVGLLVNLGIAHRHPNAWVSRIHWSGLLLFAGLSLISGSINAFDMGLGLATTCQFAGLIAAVILIRKYWKYRTMNVDQS
ncbi:MULTISPECIES: helix-turn-helix domain-containing protein [unclassified Levilactobacillus]|uniref:helix-turn-helix domain-containing protein n=1 Tax=unclassified Levilactobacillus TaxID=2767918 RepID=UPI002FF070AB